MSDALARCDRVVALLSRAYFERHRYTTEEWTATLLHQPGTGAYRLVPVRVEDLPAVVMPPVLAPLVFADVFGVNADQARRVLLDAVAGPRRPDGEPVFPGSGRPDGLARLRGAGPRLPGSVPRVWNLPARNPGFTGRDSLLVAVRERLTAGDRTVVQAFAGMGGVGKTQLAAEYAYRFAGAYDLGWWMNSEQAGLIGDQFAALGAALGCVEPGADVEAVRLAVLGELRERGRWLLVFDNAETPADVRAWLPGGGGHVLITSRRHSWGEIAMPVEVDVLARPESVAVMQARVAGLGESDADRLADRLGDLPLAVAQAAGFMAETGMPAGEYLRLLETQPARLLDHGTPGSYPQSLAAATRLTAERLEADDPGAAELAGLCAFLGPEPIPESLFTANTSELPEDLAASAADPLAWRQNLRQLTRRSLARVDHRGLVMHRLTQAILRDRLTAAQAAAARSHSEAILVASNPRDQRNPSVWPNWAQLIPHLLAADLAGTANPDLREMACNACGYLLNRGEAFAAHDLASDLRRQWREQRGDDDEHAMSAASHLAWALYQMGRYAEARDLGQDTLNRRRRIFGANHPSALTSASNLATRLEALGEVQAARDLEQDTLDRRRQVLGDNHPETLRSASNLASYLTALGEVQAARTLAQDTLERRRQVHGNNHPSTLTSASNLATDLAALGEVQAARNIEQDTLDRRRRVLGHDHPETLRSASNLASYLAAFGEVQAARDLEQDTLDRRRQILGLDHPATQRSASNLADYQHRLAEARNDT
jgi:hypothetical protein